MSNTLPLRAIVSHDRCTGVAMCVQAARSAFRLNPAGLAEFVPDHHEDEDQLHDAVEACPMSAITLTRSKE